MEQGCKSDSPLLRGRICRKETLASPSPPSYPLARKFQGLFHCTSSDSHSLASYVIRPVCVSNSEFDGVNSKLFCENVHLGFDCECDLWVSSTSHCARRWIVRVNRVGVKLNILDPVYACRSCHHHSGIEGSPREVGSDIQENFNLPCDEFSFFCCCGLDLYYCWLTCRRTAKIFFSRKDNLHRSTCFHGEKRCYDVNRIQIHPPAKGSSNVWLDHSHSFARYAESISKLPLIHERRLSIRVYREYAVSPV